MKAIQLRMARAAIGWGVRELAEKAGVTANTVTRIENGADAKQSTIDALQRALEAAGIEFTNGDQPGVRLTKAAAARLTEPGSVAKPTGGRESSPSQNRQGEREETISVASRLHSLRFELAVRMTLLQFGRGATFTAARCRHIAPTISRLLYL